MNDNRDPGQLRATAVITPAPTPRGDRTPT